MIIEADMFLRYGTFLTNNKVFSKRHILVLVRNTGRFHFLHLTGPDVVKGSLL